MASYILTALKFYSNPLLISYYIPSLSSQPAAFIVSRSREMAMALESGTKGEIKAIHTMTATRYLLGVFFEKIITRWSLGGGSFVSHCFTRASNSVLKFWSETKSQFRKDCSSFVAGFKNLDDRKTYKGWKRTMARAIVPAVWVKWLISALIGGERCQHPSSFNCLCDPHCSKLPACFYITEGFLLVF